MKKILACLLAAILLMGVAAADTVDLTALSDAELAVLNQQVDAELAARAAKTPETALSDLRYASNGKEVRIISYIGATGDAYIPDEIDGVPVTQIYNDAFDEFGEKHVLRSVRLPAGLVTIGTDAFKSTYQLTSVLVMPKTLTRIGSSAFCWSGLKGVVFQSDCELPIQTFAFTDGISFCYIREGCAVTLGSLTFQDSSLETVVIPASVTSIEDDSFYGCNNLTVYCPAGSFAEQYCMENFIICNTKDYDTMVAHYEGLYPAE